MFLFTIIATQQKNVNNKDVKRTTKGRKISLPLSVDVLLVFNFVAGL